MENIGSSQVLAENLLHYRRVRRVSLRDLSGAAGVAISALSRIESGRGNPRLETLEGIARALDVAAHDLVTPRVGGPRLKRARESSKQHRRGLTTYLVDTITVGPIEIDVAIAYFGRSDWRISGEVTYAHVLLLNGELDVDFGDDLVTLRQGDYLRFEAGAGHRFMAKGVMAKGVLLSERHA